MNKYKMTGSVLLAAVLVSGLLAGCAAASGNTTGMEGEEENMSVNTENKMTDEENLHTIYLAGGCFWGTEKYMRCVDGVLETRVGYALGEKPLWNPPLKESVTYEEVCNHSGHAEAVEVVFDAEKISLTEILREYCYTIDPTSLGRQGMDIGIQYRTGIYSLTEKQRQTAQAFLDMLKQPVQESIGNGQPVLLHP